MRSFVPISLVQLAIVKTGNDLLEVAVIAFETSGLQVINFLLEVEVGVDFGTSPMLLLIVLLSKR